MSYKQKYKIKIEIDGVFHMVDKHNTKDNLLFNEMTLDEQEEYFSFRQRSFMHNIDTLENTGGKNIRELSLQYCRDDVLSNIVL